MVHHSDSATSFNEEVRLFRRPDTVFAIGRALKGHVDFEANKLFGISYGYNWVLSSAKTAIEFFDARVLAARRAVDTWTLIGKHFKVCEDVLDGVMDALNDCSDALRGFVPVIALDWCNSMQSVKNAGKKDWWEVLSLKTEIELIYLMGWLSSPSLKEGLQQFSWLANFNNLVDKEALQFLAAKSDTPVRVVELRKGKFVSERLFG